MTHLYHENKSIARLLGDVDTNTKDLAKTDNSNYVASDTGTLSLGIGKDTYYKLKSTLVSKESTGNDRFSQGTEGSRGSIAVDGNFAVIGAPYHNDRKGMAVIYQYDTVNDIWNELQKIEASDGESFFKTSNGLYESYGDRFGESVAIHGNYIVVGAIQQNLNKGSAYIYEYVSTTNTWNYKQKLTDSNPGFGLEDFAFSISINNDTLAIGVPSWDAKFVNVPIGGYWDLDVAGHSSGQTFVWSTSIDHGLSVGDSIYFISKSFS